MKRILINGINAKTGGGKSILTNLLQTIKSQNSSEIKYFILSPDPKLYQEFESEKINIVDIPNIFKKNLLFIGLFYWAIPNLLKKYKINSILNLSNIPIPTKIHQVFLFQWAYAVYPESTIWKKMELKDKLIRKTKILFFKINCKFIDVCIAQTTTIEKRLKEQYNLNQIKVIPNSVTFIDSPEPVKTSLPKGEKLLYLTHYYPHKNFEVLIPFAEKIKENNLDFKIITTIEESQHKGAELFLKEVSDKNLTEIIINIGPITINQISSLYNQCDALLMPTLLESYGLTYIEAMNFDTPIIASDLDFAHTVCKNGAVYFQPFDGEDLFNVTKDLFSNPEKIENLKANGKEILKGIPSWEVLIEKYVDLLKNTGR